MNALALTGLYLALGVSNLPIQLIGLVLILIALPKMEME
jgi:hypothetical protein